MAQMPRGEPRTVPDPAGEKVDAMLRQERLRKQRAEAALAKPPPSGNLPAFSSFGHVDSIRRISRQSSTITIGNRTYREIDNGRANVLVPVDPLFTPAERAAQREGVVRALFMAGHPFGTVAYGAASIAGAPQRTRDAALLAGGLVDDVAVGGVSRARTVRSRPVSPGNQGPPLKRDRIRFGGLAMDQPATYVGGTATADMLGAGTRPDRRIKPPGWRGNGTLFNEARGHLSAAQLGGPGHDARNLVTLTQNRTNSSDMKRFENAIARNVRNGEVVEYLTMPLYTQGVLPPSAILMTAYGSRSGPSARIIHNPAGRPR